MAKRVRIAVIGAGQVTDSNHIPGIRLHPHAELAAICDTDRELLRRRQQEWGPVRTSIRFEEIAEDTTIDGVVIATPNSTHLRVALACIEAGKHVMCEKPIGLNTTEARQLLCAALASGVRHMTAFTYRFAPAMRYLKHLLAAGALGTPRHFRSQRFLDFGESSLGWRQYRRLAGGGILYDMAVHRVDFAQDLLGSVSGVCGRVAQFVQRDRMPDGQPCEPSDVDDWYAFVGEFDSGAVGVWEASWAVKGRREADGSQLYDWAEVNCDEGSAAYRLSQPNHIFLGASDGGLEPRPVPSEFLVAPGSLRDPGKGNPTKVFAYDLIHEFVSAIIEGRDANPGFEQGVAAQAVVDAVLQSHTERRWVDVA